MKKKIHKYLDNVDKYAPEMAKEIIDEFTSRADANNIDYSFTINRDTGKVYDEKEDPNTYFVFEINRYRS